MVIRSVTADAGVEDEPTAEHEGTMITKHTMNSFADIVSWPSCHRALRGGIREPSVYRNRTSSIVNRKAPGFDPAENSTPRRSEPSMPEKEANGSTNSRHSGPA